MVISSKSVLAIIFASLLFVGLVSYMKRCSASDNPRPEIVFHMTQKTQSLNARPLITMRGIPFDQVCQLCPDDAHHFHFRPNETMSLCDMHEASYNAFVKLLKTYKGKETYASYLDSISLSTDSQSQ